MIQVSVKPESFEIVFYDAAVIGEVVAEVAERLGRRHRVLVSEHHPRRALETLRDVWEIRLREGQLGEPVLHNEVLGARRSYGATQGRHGFDVESREVG